MAVIVGIDEAGYGPLLGPLVVSAAALKVPDEMVSVSLWRQLEDAVCMSKKGSKGRILINDSKKLHHKTGDYSLLARSVIACRAAAAESATDMPLPGTIEEFFKLLNFKDLDCFDDYFWYKNLCSEKISYDKTDVSIVASGLWRTMRKSKISIEYMSAIPMPVGQYNKAVELTGNKSVVLFNQACKHIFHAWEKFSRDNLNVVIDKQGGRSNYRDKLQKIFPYAKINELKRTPHLSSYHIIDGNRSMKTHFIAKGDQKQLAIALASMVSKLVRELMVEQLNKYYALKVPGIKYTAGYYQDGMRFLDDLKAANAYSPKIDHLLVRIK